jgi:hypothetical protein
MLSVLQACGGPVFTRQDFDSTTARSFWTYAAAGKPFLVEVYNAPPQVTPEALAEAFPSPGGPVAPVGRFVANPENAARPDYRFALLFDAAAGIGGDAICRLRSQQTVLPPSNDDAVHAAFCHRGDAITDVRAVNAADVFHAGPASDEARQFLYRLGTALLPPLDVDRERRRPPLILPDASASLFPPE